MDRLSVIRGGDVDAVAVAVIEREPKLGCIGPSTVPRPTECFVGLGCARLGVEDRQSLLGRAIGLARHADSVLRRGARCRDNQDICAESASRAASSSTYAAAGWTGEVSK